MNQQIFEVEFLNTASQIPDTLWEACFQPPAEGRWWYDALDQSGIDDQFTFLYALISHLGCPAGIVPLFLMDVPIEQVAPQVFLRGLRLVGKVAPSVFCQRTLFVGSPILDEGRVGLISQVNRRDALLFLEMALEKKARELRAPMIVWKDFPENSTADLKWLSQQRRFFRVISFPNTVVELRSDGKDDYFASLRGSRRRKLKAKLKRSKEQVGVRVEIVQRPDAKTLDEIFGLFWQTYEKSPAKFERLNRRFFELIAEKQPVHFIILRENGRGEMIAFMLCFDMGKRLVNMFIGMDYSRPKEWFIFFRLWEAAIDLALSRGISTIVSGRSSYEAKFEMGHKLVPLNNYCRHRNVLLHHIYRTFAQKIHWSSMDDALARFLKAHPQDGLQ